MGERGEHGGYLAGELAGGHEHQPARRLGPAWLRAVVRRASMGRPNASVLPEPVCARPRTSRPASASGTAAAWIGNGAVTPLSGERGHQGCGDAEVRECSSGRDRRVECSGKCAVQVGLLALAR